MINLTVKGAALSKTIQLSANVKEERIPEIFAQLAQAESKPTVVEQTAANTTTEVTTAQANATQSTETADELMAWWTLIFVLKLKLKLKIQ